MAINREAKGMIRQRRRQGSRLHRLFIRCLSVLLTLLLFWLLGFVVRDIGDLEGPDYQTIEAEYVAQEVRDELRDLEGQRASLGTQITNQQAIQGILQQSTNESRTTMNQLIEIHRLNLEKGVTPTEDEQQALSESERLFLSKQQEFQAANEEIARLSEERRDIEERIRELNAEKDESREPAREQYEREVRLHRIKVASFKLLFLVPVLLIAAGLVAKYRARDYASILYPLLVAAFWRVGVVTHQYFPEEWFRYIATSAGIVVVLGFLLQLIRMAASPKTDWLLKQYRQAYNEHRCPICGHPIRRGPLKHAIWTAKGPKETRSSVGEDETASAYTCPSCGKGLFEECVACSSIRHSFLPYCESCGDEKPIGTGSSGPSTEPTTRSAPSSG